MVFESVEIFETVVKAHKADKGLQENVEKLDKYIKNKIMLSQNQQQKLIITREFNAPQQKVFEAFASESSLAQWWGPANSKIEVINFDFKPNGKFHYKGDMMGQVVYGMFKYTTINPINLIEFVSSFANENAEVIRAPFNQDFPLEIFNRVQFAELNGKTIITLTGYPINATENEINFYTSMQSAMQAGFNGTLNQLENFLNLN